MDILKQSTSATIVMGPFLDSTDGNTAETGLTITQADIRMSKNGGTFAQTNNSAGATHMEGGKYSVPLDATDTNTLGRIRVDIHEAGALATWREFTVVTANAYDTLCSTDAFDVNVISEANIDFGATKKASINAECDTANTDYGANTTTPPTVTAIRTEMDDNSTKMAPSQTLADYRATGFSVPSEYDTVIAALQTDLDNPAQYKADVSAIALEATLTAMKGATFSGATDSLEALRDRGDAAWTTGAGGSDRLLMVDTTIATLSSQTSFTLNAGSADDGAYNNCTIVIEDASTAAQKAVGIVSDYTGATKTVTLKYDPAIFAMAGSDKIYILAENALKATAANRQLNVAADGDIAGNVDGSVASLVGHTAQTGDSFARLGAPAGASVSADLVAIDNFVDELESRLSAIRAGYLDNLSVGAVAQASVATETRLAELDAGNIPAVVSDIPTTAEFNARSDLSGTAATPAEVATALSDIHLDHLLAADYDPASKPGTATALLNELVENDGGVSRYTSNALENAPSAGTNPNVLIDTTILSVTTQTEFTLTAGSSEDDAYKDQAFVIYDASTSNFPSVRVCSGYVGSSRTVTLDSAPDFTVVNGDGCKAFVTAPGTTAPTVGQIRTEMEGGGYKLALIEADTAELQTNQGAWATATTVALSAQGKLDVNIEADTALSDINLDHLCKTATATDDMTTEVADDTILSRMLSNGDTSNFIPSTDGMQSIRDAITTTAPQSFVPVATSTVVTGTEGGTYADAATDNATHWSATDAGDAVEVIAQIEILEGRLPTSVLVNGYFSSGASRIVEIYAYNYNSEVYDKLSAGTASTEMRNSVSDSNYNFNLLFDHHDHSAANHGEVKIRFLANTQNATDALYLDQVLVNAQPEGGLTTNAIAEAVANYDVLDVRKNGGIPFGHAVKYGIAIDTDVATTDSQVSFTLSDGVAANDVHEGMVLSIRDNSAASRHLVSRRIIGWTSGLVVTLDKALGFDPAIGDPVHILTNYADVNVTHVGEVAQTGNDNGADINEILLDSDELQANQGDWATATGFATEAKQDIIDTNIDQIEAAVITNAAGTDIAADIIAVKAETASVLEDTGTTLEDHLTDIKGTAFVKDTDSLPQCLTATGFSTHDAAAVKTAIEAGGSSIALVKAVTDALTAAAATKLSKSAGTIITGAAETGTLSTTEMTTNLVLSVNEQYNGRILIFQSDTATAALRNQATNITDSLVTGGKLTFTALTTAPSATDAFVIV